MHFKHRSRESLHLVKQLSLLTRPIRSMVFRWNRGFAARICGAGFSVGHERSVRALIAGVGALEVVDDPHEAVEKMHAVLCRFHTDELEAQRSPTLINGFTMT